MMFQRYEGCRFCLLLLIFVLAVFRGVRRQMFPQAIVAPLELVVQPLAALVLHQALAFAAFLDDNDRQFRVYLPLAIPVAACCADFHFGRENQFFAHIGCG